MCFPEYEIQGCCICGREEEAVVLRVGGYTRSLCTACYREIDKLMCRAADLELCHGGYYGDACV